MPAAPEHLSYDQFRELQSEAEGQVEIGGIYRHYKQAQYPYVVKGIGFMEANNEICVLYGPVHEPNLTFVRPLAYWLEPAVLEGISMARFEHISPTS